MTGDGTGCRADTQPASVNAPAPMRKVRLAIVGLWNLLTSDMLLSSNLASEGLHGPKSIVARDNTIRVLKGEEPLYPRCTLREQPLFHRSRIRQTA